MVGAGCWPTSDQGLRRALRPGPVWREKDNLLRTGPGIGERVSRTPPAHLPELGALSRQQVAASVGVAPHNRNSGAWRGKRTVRGGRARVSAARFNPVIRDIYQRSLTEEDLGGAGVPSGCLSCADVPGGFPRLPGPVLAAAQGRDCHHGYGSYGYWDRLDADASSSGAANFPLFGSTGPLPFPRWSAGAGGGAGTPLGRPGPAFATVPSPLTGSRRTDSPGCPGTALW